MIRVLVTGSNGFIGQNLLQALKRLKNIEPLTFDKVDSLDKLESQLKKADFIFHLAGINRPENTGEFATGNTELTGTITTILSRLGKTPGIVFSSTIHANSGTPYGRSKKKAEAILLDFSKKTGTPVYIYRLPNVFGKWCRPNYNSVVATFCHNISHGLPISISDPGKEIALTYIDHVVDTFVNIMLNPPKNLENQYLEVSRVFRITLEKLANIILQFKNIRETLVVPDLSDELIKNLYTTYTSHLDKKDFTYPLNTKTDNRGCLTELIKSHYFGQVVVSKTNKGFCRGNHYHDSKVEKFCIIQGKALVKFRDIRNLESFSYTVSGDCPVVIDVPPGYAHSIENLSSEELIVIFWANEIFDPQKADTFFCEVGEKP